MQNKIEPNFMAAPSFNLQKYFDRIRYQGQFRKDIATLSAIMRRQLFSVPFENLDVQAGKIISMTPDDIVKKVIDRKRGGYCYELNGIFAMALDAMQIPYRFVSARPMYYPSRRPRTHMALIVYIASEEWLFDLGFGSHGIRAPMLLNHMDTEIEQDNDRFALSRENNQTYILKAFVDSGWKNQYAFDLSPQEWIDFIPANYYNSTHPDTIFKQKMLVILHTESGRKILSGDIFKKINWGNVEERKIQREDCEALLREEFCLTLEN